MYYVGQEVVCIKEEDPERYYECALPRLNCHYTVRAIQEDGIWLHEIVNKKMVCEHTLHGGEIFDEPNFDIKHFRPVQKKQTDISVFTNMLKERELVE